MSTIGPEYSAHRRSVDDLEQDYENASRKAKEREKIRDAKLEKNLESIVKKKDSELEKTVKDVKDEFSSSMKNQAKADRVERERLKQNIYDRNGRRVDASTEAATTDRDRAIEAASAAEARAAKSISDAERYRDAQSSSATERHEREMEAMAESYRKQISEARGGNDEGETQSLREYRKKLSEESQAAIKQAREEVIAERRQAKILAEQSQQTLKSREKKSDDLLTTRLREKNIAVKTELGKQAEANRVSRELELQPLREQVMETAGLQRDAAKAKNEARAEAIKDLESDWNSKYQNQSLSHELEKGKLRADQGDAERIYGEKMGRFMTESNQKTSSLVAKQNAESRDQLTMSSQAYERSMQDVKRQAAHEKELSNKLLARERQNATERQDRALKTQAETYQETLANQRKAQGGQIRNLERVLNNKNSTDDPGEISAAAEQSVRSAVSKQYDKVFQAEADRNARDREHVDFNYKARLNDAISDKQIGITEANRKNMKEQTTMRNEFVQHVEDVESNKRQMLNLAADANAKMTESTQRNSERGMNEMRRHYEDLISERDADHAAKFEDYRNQAEFEKRTMRRENQIQAANLIRTYEKRMAEQKATSENQLQEVKGKLDRLTHDSDKRLNKALADQARGFEHRFSVLEAQSKDRERQSIQLHEDELDKVKKANALLLSKKG